MESNKCIYCGNDANSRDHIPPKNLFVTTKGINFITVPSCVNCNNSFSPDEEYFREFLTTMSYGESITATTLFDTKIKRAIRRNINIAKKFKQKAKLVDYYYNGIFIGKKTAIRMDGEDWQRYHNVLNKIIKGLFYHEYNIVIPPDYKIKHSTLTDEMFNNSKNILKLLKKKFIGEGVFSYGFGKVENDCHCNSMWVTIFYKKTAFLSLVMDKDYKD